MDLTAAFEELLKRKGRREGYQYRHRVSPLSAFTREQLEAIKVRSKELTATMGQIKAASPLLPQHPICNWIVPTLHILLGIINDIVSRWCLHGRASRGGHRGGAKSQLAQDEKHYALAACAREEEANL
jgi:hypothetical protein